jgi:hypothetical protein
MQNTMEITSDIRPTTALTSLVTSVPSASYTGSQIKVAKFSSASRGRSSTVVSSQHEGGGDKPILDRRGGARRPSLTLALQRVREATAATEDDVEDDEELPKFCSMSSHDWLCNCRLPRTVRPVTALSRQKPWQPNVYERTYVLPPGGSLKQSTATGKEAGADEKDKTKNWVEGGDEKNSVRVLDSCPITCRKPFLVLSPYWAKTSRRHLQQWPWQGALHCGLWSFTSGHDVTEHGRHKNCFCKCGKLTSSSTS